MGHRIGDSTSKIPELQATSEESIGPKAQLQEDLKKHQVDRSSTKAAIDSQHMIRKGLAAQIAVQAAQIALSASRTDSLQLILVGRRFENLCVDFLIFWNKLFVFMKLVCMLRFFAYSCPFHVAFQFTFIFPIAF